jgi:hypothetical protein
MSKARYALTLVAALAVGSILTVAVFAAQPKKGQRPPNAPNVQAVQVQVSPLVDQQGRPIGTEITGDKGTVWVFDAGWGPSGKPAYVQGNGVKSGGYWFVGPSDLLGPAFASPSK